MPSRAAVLGILALAWGAAPARDHSGPPRRRVELLPLVALKHDLVRGSWAVQGGALVCEKPVDAARVAIPYLPPPEYDLVVIAERTSGEDAFVMGLTGGDAQFVHVFDGYTAEGKCLSGFEVLDGQPARSNESMREGGVFVNGTPSALHYAVRRGGVRVSANGRRVLDWKGDFKRLSVRADYRVNNPGILFVGAWKSTFRITRVSLYPIGAPGRPLRD